MVFLYNSPSGIFLEDVIFFECLFQIRPASTAQVGHAGGLNITFKVEENAKEAELSLTGTQQGKRHDKAGSFLRGLHCNMITVE